jgi:hypothetical protein
LTISGLVRISGWLPIEYSDQNVVVFVLDEARSDIFSIKEFGDFLSSH